MRYRLSQIGTGENGTDQTVRELARLVDLSLHRPYIRILAIGILDRANTSSREPVRAAQALFNWVRVRIRYIKDTLNIETIQDPEITAKLQAGDCDDHAALLAALALSVGIPVRFVVLGPSRQNFQHIYTEMLCAGRWVPVDTASDLPFGAVKSLPARKIYNYTGESKMIGISGPTEIMRVTVGQVKAVAYDAAMKKLKANWNNGLINQQDLKSYLQVIDGGNSPGRGTIVEAPMRQAIVGFLAYVTSKNMQSFKPIGAVSGLEGLDGFLKSVWGAVKGAVKGVAKIVTGGGGTLQVKLPSLTQPSATVTPGQPSAMQEITGFLTSPVALIAGAAILAIILLRK